MIEIAIPQYYKRLNWYDSVLYCRFLNIDNKIGWRLPTFDEMLNILKPTNEYYWTSSELNPNTNCNLILSLGENINDFIYTSRRLVKRSHPPFCKKTFTNNVVIPVREAEM